LKYATTIEYLYGLQQYGMKFGLDNIRLLMSELGNPHQSFRSIHVAGTNGKGSTSAMLESILRTGRIKTGLFTSPHLVSFTERIKVNNQEISEEDVIRLADEVRTVVERTDDFSPTFFEVVTAMVFLYFKKMKVDWAVIETGMGGRLDATNIICPEVSVITSIGYDHRDFLGKTLSEIAGEKAGIIKENVPVVTASQAPEVMKVIQGKALETASELFRYDSEFSSTIVSDNGSPDDIDSVRLDYYGRSEYEDLHLLLAGEHQVMNASLAVKTAEIISEKYPYMDLDIRKGLENTVWPGRLEMIGHAPDILIDGAHNPPAAEVLALHLKKMLVSKYKRIILIIGMMADKDIKGILQPLLPMASEIIFASPAYGRAASVEMLSSQADSFGYSSRKAVSVSGALREAEDLYREGDIIVVTGSFYTIGEAKEALGSRGVLARLRE
jgi:dihydrofolate synthase / folylpolyglutamate synthase